MTKRIRAAIAALLLSLVIFTSVLQAGRQIVIIYTDSSSHTTRTIAGLEWSLKESQAGCTITEFFLANTEPTQKKNIQALNPHLLITVGSTATSFADHAFPELPIVFAKVLNPIESGFIQSWERPGRHLTGATLDIPVEMQLQKLTEMIPNLKKVGVIYNNNTDRLVEDARKAAAALGIQVISYKLTAAKELPKAVDSLCRSAEAIWTVADEELSTPQFVRYTLLETLRHRIPVMGFNQTFVESGALFCLEADYKYIGRQAAQIAGSVLNGADPAKTKVSVPDIIYLYLNLKSGKLLNLNLPPELVNVAKETY